MLTQEQFDKFVENYNEDFVLLLTRASQQYYDCLISSFTILNDLYRVIIKLQETQGFEFRVHPYPLSFRGNDSLLKELGFDGNGINAIYGFLEYVKSRQGMEFEEALEAKQARQCRTPQYVEQRS